MSRSGFRYLIMFFVCFLGIMIGIASAYAEEETSGRDQDARSESSGDARGSSSGAKKPPKRVNINFEDELVEGGANKPELFYLLQKRQFNYKRLIKLRENFIPEMKSTAEDVQRRGSGD